MLARHCAAKQLLVACAAKQRPRRLLTFAHRRCADDLGVGDLGVTGHPTTHTPNIDALANGGVRFTAWYSGFHICSPSRAAMLTGRLCVRSGTCGANWLGGVFSNKPVGGLPTSEITFATALKGVGYTTAAMGKCKPRRPAAHARPRRTAVHRAHTAG